MAANHQEKLAKARLANAAWKKRNPWMVSYAGAMTRCNNKNAPQYRTYGGRGVECRLTVEQVKELWERDNAANMKRPSIDRIDSSGHYEKGNCRFIEQALNASLGSKMRNDKFNRCAERHPGTPRTLEISGSGRWPRCAPCHKISQASYEKRRRK